MRSFFQAFFLDIPSLIDSQWRHVEYALNAEFKFQPGPHLKITRRPVWTRPPFWFFVITVFFASYGPTWDALCATFPQPVAEVLRRGLGLLIAFGSLALGVFLANQARASVGRRFDKVERDLAKQGLTLSPVRRATSAAVICLVLVAGMMVGVWAGGYIYEPSSDQVCATGGRSIVAGWRFAMCLLAVAVFAAVMHLRPASVRDQVVAQAVILVAVLAVQWLLLAPGETTEASDRPYRHIFLVWAPCIVLVVALAPVLAWLAYQSGHGVTNAARQRLRALLPETELFVNRPDDLEPSWQRIGYAIIYGPGYHPLHLLLLPALVALVAPVKTLYPWTIAAFIVSFFLLVWGSASSRWQEMVDYIERWFLRGTTLFISLFVIVVAGLRLAKFDYVSAILDTIPFGMIFGLVVMNYVLFWLAEYWMSRAAAAQLLGVLGTVTDGVHINYPRDSVDPDIRVDQTPRVLAIHGTGRLIALGTTHDAQQQPVRAFQTHYLMGLFSRIGDRTGIATDHDHVADLQRRTGLYFFGLNALLIALTIGFSGFFVYEHYWANNLLRPIVTARAAPPAAGGVDLAARLQQDLARPAVVVIGSGGGTRAALYTASVLNGLHRLGVDRDIELLSGVSGGGVALAYFAANKARLTATTSGGAQEAKECPLDNKAPRSTAEEWICYTRAVTKPFIEDVLNGATEWRVYRTTALTALLAESFERNLFPKEPSLGSLGSPALILNSAIVAHPEEESAALSRTIEHDKSCEERERPFKLLGGGRMIFTNLQHADAFPGKQSPIPDVRLPYRIVQDPTVMIANAAALNANFPPVFPNARVRITGEGDGDCKERSYYVTDGGAEENLGLISALYALESALAHIGANTRLRPIHVVIAEASAVSYDYTQDHGISAGMSGSRERLAGGLTNLLLERVEAKLKQLHPENSVRYHYLGLPLAFRARGGFGTHWLYAKEFHLNDPRPRTTYALNLRPTALGSEQKAAITQRDLELLWLGLHDPKQPFCSQPYKDELEKVRKWICGADGTDVRDLHIKNWKDLVEALQRS